MNNNKYNNKVFKIIKKNRVNKYKTDLIILENNLKRIRYSFNRIENKNIINIKNRLKEIDIKINELAKKREKLFEDKKKLNKNKKNNLEKIKVLKIKLSRIKSKIRNLKVEFKELKIEFKELQKENKKMTIEELAYLIKVNQNILTKIENSKIYPDKQIRKRICKVLGVSEKQIWKVIFENELGELETK